MSKVNAARWRAIREANTVPGSSDPRVWRKAYLDAMAVGFVEIVLDAALPRWQRELVKAVSPYAVR